MTPKTVNKSEKKKEIGKAAISVFSQQGFEKASINKISQVANIGKGTVFEYFKNKEDLIEFVIESLDEEFKNRVFEDSKEIANSRKRIKAFVNGWLGELLQNIELMGVTVNLNYFLSLNQGEKRYQEVIIKKKNKDLSKIIEILNEGVEKGIFKKNVRGNAEKIALNISTFINGIILQKMLLVDLFDAKQQTKFFLNAVLKRISISRKKDK